MKRNFTLFAFVVITLSAYAYDVYIDGIYYDLFLKTKEAYVTCKDNYGMSYSGSIVIPEKITYDGIEYPITKIGDAAFYQCPNLVSVTIPTSVTSIGSLAFYHCSKLSSVIIPNTVTNIEMSTFQSCSNLTSVSLPNNLTNIPSYMFAGCTKLANIDIPNSVKTIEYQAFRGCSTLTSVKIPDVVATIGIEAFKGCSAITQIQIGKSVSSIDSRAFSECRNIELVYCYAENMSTTKTDVFNESYIGYATLYVPEKSYNAYKTTSPWNEFGTIKTIEGANPETRKCAAPSIVYEDGKLYFSTATPQADVVSEIKDADIKTHYDKKIALTATYEISAYATKSGYDDSDVATATLVWATATFTPGETTNAKEMTVDALPLLITQEDGMVTVSGIADGAIITAYGTNGTMVASAKAVGNAALLNLSDLQGKVAVLNVNGKSAKVAIK